VSRQGLPHVLSRGGLTENGNVLSPRLWAAGRCCCKDRCVSALPSKAVRSDVVSLALGQLVPVTSPAV